MKSIILFFILFVFLGNLKAESPPKAVVLEIESTLAPKNVKAKYHFINKRSDGTDSEYTVLFDIGDSDHARGLFIEPPREKGREILRIGEEIWTYMPSAGRTVRVADRDSFAGGDFSNADVLRVDWSNQYENKLKKELSDQWIFEQVAKSKEASYAKMLLWVDKKSRQPVQQIFYDSQGTKLKRLRYGDVKKFKKITRPTRLVMENLITKQKSEMHVLQFELVSEIKGSRFVPDNLGK